MSRDGVRAAPEAILRTRQGVVEQLANSLEEQARDIAAGDYAKVAASLLDEVLSMPARIRRLQYDLATVQHRHVAAPREGRFCVDCGADLDGNIRCGECR